MPYDPNRFDQRNERLIELGAQFVERCVVPYHRATIRGVERIPSGPALYVGNHSGALLSIDTFIAFARVFARRGLDDLPFGLAHSVAVRAPLLNQILVPLGAVEASHDNLERAFDAGKKVLVYPGGDIDSMRPFRHRNRVKFGGRTGFMRAALRHRVPIVPLVAAGAHGTLIIIDDLPWLAKLLGVDERFRIEVWPLALSIPWGVTLGPTPPYFPLPAKIDLEFLEPITFEHTGPEAADDPAYVASCARRVRNKMQLAMDRLVG
ncbi:MAG: 1-acyl-sn-glycerol-3-phosphate acyltransferase [Persicimonas sp.]